MSRRLSVIIGTALIGIGLIVWGAWPLFGTILIGQVLWGIGATFTSGATEAWISDETGNVQTGRIYLRAAQWGWAAGALGIVASVPLAALWGLQAPILAGGIGYLMTARGPRLRHARAALVAGAPRRAGRSSDPWATRCGVPPATVRMVPALLTILAISFVAGAGSEAFDRLRELHILSNFALPTARSCRRSPGSRSSTSSR